jgi:hypothetical protein
MVPVPLSGHKKMSTPSKRDSNDAGNAEGVVERRRADRTDDDTDWESKVLGRLNGRLHDLPADADQPSLGWESSVLDVLRKRIEKGPA